MDPGWPEIAIALMTRQRQPVLPLVLESPPYPEHTPTRMSQVHRAFHGLSVRKASFRGTWCSRLNLFALCYFAARPQPYSSSSLSSGASVGLENSMRYPSGSVSGTTQRLFPTNGRFRVWIPRALNSR